MKEPVIALREGSNITNAAPLSAPGDSFSIYEWRGSGPATLHIHYQDDEAWHVLEGTLKFRFVDHEVEAPAGTTVFVPAGVPHTYEARDARYLIILTPRLAALIRELQQSPDRQAHAEIYRKYESELLE